MRQYNLVSEFNSNQIKLAKRILLTLGYSAQFRQPLTTTSLWQRLLLGGDKREFCRVLIRLWQLRLVKADLGVIGGGVREFEKGFKKGSLGSINWQLAGLPAQANLTQKSHQLTSELEIQEVVKFVRLVPFVRALAVTGSVAAGSSQQGDDLDLMVIASVNRLWLVRPIILLYALFKGKRRSWHREEPGSWCFNLWLDENNLQMSRSRQNLYTAYELCQARFVLDRGIGNLSLEQRMMVGNSWVACLMPNFWQSKYCAGQVSSSLSRQKYHWGVVALVVSTVLSPILDIANWLAFLTQSLYMKRHQTTEEVRLGAAFFHPRDTKSILYLGWRAVMSYWGSSSVRESMSDLSLKASPNSLGVSEAASLSQKARAQGKRVVLATGVFDLLHSAHLEFLRLARREGDVLVVGIESDLRVRQMKGAGRPIFEEGVRQRRLALIKGEAESESLIDGVFVLPADFNNQEVRRRLLSKLRPNVLAVSDHSPHQSVKAKMMAKIGGELRVVTPQIRSVSTTSYRELVFDRIG